MDRFLLEARLAASLDHPYGAHVYAFGVEADGLLWIAMELVRGTPLDAFIRQSGSVPPKRLVPFLQRLAEVVDAAHEVGIIHRDIKPANVMVLVRAGALFPKLLDFGVAAALTDAAAPDAGADRARAPYLVGSPHYMAPEQWHPSAVPRACSDLYSLAVLAFEALTGKVPFDAPTLDGIAERHTVAPIPRLYPEAPGPLDAILARALAKQPEDRFPTAQAFVEALRSVTARSARRVPELGEESRNACLLRAPRPIAEAVADLCDAVEPHEALDALAHLYALIVRWLGLLALTVRLRARNPLTTDREREILRALRQRSLSIPEWVELARSICAPYAAERELFPIPDLVDTFLDGNRFVAFDSLQGLGHPNEARALELLDAGLPAMTTLLESLAFLEHYPLVVGRDEGAEQWMGIRHGRGRFIDVEVPIGNVALVTLDATILLDLSPLILARRPLPSSEEELFLLDRGEGSSACLVSPRAGFTMMDEHLWGMLEATLALGDAAAPASRVALEHSPYLGLASFSRAEAASFVGRERDIEAVLNRMRVQAFVGIVGPSGAGKTSFIAAGIVPALSTSMRAFVVRPGVTPVHTMLTRLRAAGLVDRDAPDWSGPRHLADHLIGAADAEPLLFVVDQFEELFTICNSPAEREYFAALLGRLAHNARESLRIIVALRDDFVVRFETLPALRDLLAQGFHFLSTPTVSDLERILVEPARAAGYEFDDASLPVEMAADVAARPGALATLSFTALRLWEQRDRQVGRLTRRVYDSMGGVGGALAQHAESMLSVMTQDERAMVRAAFRMLITTEGTRSLRERSEVVAALGGGPAPEALIERLIAARLLITTDADVGVDNIEIIHETLATAWPRLVSWLQDDRDGARFHEQVRAAALQWDQRSRPSGLLWTDDALAELRAWRSRLPLALSTVESAFVTTSIASEARSRLVRRIVIAAALAALAVGVIVLAHSERRAAESAKRAEEQVALLNESKGREALFTGDPMRAIAYLDEAIRRGRDGPSVRYPLASVTRTLSAEMVSVYHGTRVWSVALTPKGDRFITGGDDGVANIWDAQTGERFRSLAGHSDRILTMEVSSDGSQLLTGGADGKALLWDLASGTIQQRLEHAGSVCDVHFLNPRGRLLTASDSGTVRLWEHGAAEPVRTLEAHAGRLWTARLSANGERLVTTSSDQTARVWDLLAGRLVATLAGHTARVYDAVFSPDGGSVATASADRTVRLWDAVTGREKRSTPVLTEEPFLVAFAPDGAKIAFGGNDKVVQLWNVRDWHLELSLIGHTSYLNSLGFSPDGATIATAGSDGTARLWDSATGQAVTTFYGHFDALWRVQFDATGRRILTAGLDGAAKLWSAERAEGLVLRGHAGAVNSAVFTRDGSRVLTTGADGTARAWDASTGALLATRELTAPGSYSQTSTWDREGRRVIMGEGVNLRLIDTSTNSVTPLGQNSSVRFVRFSSDGTRAVTAGGDSTCLWDTSSATIVRCYPWHAAWTGAAAISDDNRLLATNVDDHDVRIIDVVRDRTVAELHSDNPGFVSFEFSGDGKYLLSAGQDKSAKIWDIASRRVLSSFEGHQSDVASARFSPDGSRVVTASSDGRANIWDSVTGELLVSFSIPQPMNDASFSPDGRSVVAAGDDYAARIWPVVMDTRSPEEISKFARCRSPFRIEGARVLRVPIDHEQCRDTRLKTP